MAREPLWRAVYALFANMSPGDTISYAAICDAAGTDDMMKVYRLVSRAKRELWEERGRSIAAVPDVGYRMIRANEHGLQARRYERVAQRRVSDAVVVAQCTHLDELTDVEREGMLALQMGMQLLARVVMEGHRRIDAHDELIDGLQRRVDRLESGS